MPLSKKATEEHRDLLMQHLDSKFIVATQHWKLERVFTEVEMEGLSAAYYQSIRSKDNSFVNKGFLDCVSKHAEAGDIDDEKLFSILQGGYCDRLMLLFQKDPNPIELDRLKIRLQTEAAYKAVVVECWDRLFELVVLVVQKNPHFFEELAACPFTNKERSLEALIMTTGDLESRGVKPVLDSFKRQAEYALELMSRQGKLRELIIHLSKQKIPAEEQSFLLSLEDRAETCVQAENEAMARSFLPITESVGSFSDSGAATTEAFSHLNIGHEAEPRGPLTRKRARALLEAAEERKRARASLQAAETASSTTPSSAEELGSSSGSINANIKANRRIIDKYLKHEGFEDECIERAIFSEEEVGVIRAEPGKSNQGMKCLDILLDKEEPVLEKFIGVLKETKCEHLVPLFKGPPDEDLADTLETEAFYEKAISQRGDLELLGAIYSRMQKEGLDVFIQELQLAGVINVGMRWESWLRCQRRLDQAIAVYDKANEQFGLEKLVGHFLQDPELTTKNQRKSLLAIRKSATSADSSAPLEAGPSSKVTRESIMACFPELVERIYSEESTRLTGYCSGGIFSKAELERIEAESSRFNRARAYLLLLLSADQSAAVEQLPRTLKMLGYGRLARCLYGDSGMTDTLLAERCTKKLVNQHYLEMIKLIVSQMPVASGWSVDDRAELLSFCVELEKKEIIKLRGSWDVEELAELSPSKRADWVIARSWEQLRLGELVKFLENKIGQELRKGTKSPSGTDLVAGLKLLSGIRAKAELARASLPSDTQSSDEEVLLVRGVLKRVEQAVAAKEEILQKKEAALKAAQKQVDHAEVICEQMERAAAFLDEEFPGEEEMTGKDLTDWVQRSKSLLEGDSMPPEEAQAAWNKANWAVDFVKERILKESLCKKEMLPLVASEQETRTEEALTASKAVEQAKAELKKTVQVTPEEEADLMELEKLEVIISAKEAELKAFSEAGMLAYVAWAEALQRKGRREQELKALDSSMEDNQIRLELYEAMIVTREREIEELETAKKAAETTEKVAETTKEKRDDLIKLELFRQMILEKDAEIEAAETADEAAELRDELAIIVRYKEELELKLEKASPKEEAFPEIPDLKEALANLVRDTEELRLNLQEEFPEREAQREALRQEVRELEKIISEKEAESKQALKAECFTQAALKVMDSLKKALEAASFTQEALKKTSRAAECLEQGVLTKTVLKIVCGKAEEVLEEERQKKESMEESFLEQEASAKKHILESVEIFRELDLELVFDRCVKRGCSDLLLKDLQALLLSNCRLVVFASRLAETINDENRLRILSDALKESGQMNAIVEASQDPGWKDRRKAVYEGLGRKRRSLVDSIRPSEPLWHSSFSVGLITESGRERLLGLRGEGLHELVRKFLDMVSLQCRDDAIKKLAACLQEDCQPLPASQVMRSNYKDERAERFNKHWQKRLPDHVVKDARSLDHGCYSKILEELSRSGTITRWQAGDLMVKSRAETSRQRIANLKTMCLRFNSRQVGNTLLAIEAHYPELSTILETDDIKAARPSRFFRFFSRPTTAEPMQTEESTEERPEERSRCVIS